MGEVKQHMHRVVAFRLVWSLVRVLRAAVVIGVRGDSTKRPGGVAQLVNFTDSCNQRLHHQGKRQQPDPDGAE